MGNQYKESKTMGIISLISGIIGLFMLAIVFGPIALITGFIGISNGEPKGMNIAGIVLGIIDLLAVFMFI